MPILQTIGLEKRFGGIVAAQNVSLAIEKGARHALIGPNGAGKTTVINLLTGVLKPTAGTIMLDGRDITALDPHQRVRLGMARTFQINQLFPDLTPLEHIGLAVSERLGSGGDWWRLVGVPEAERHELLATIAALPAEVTVLLIEHDMDLVFSFADRISVLVNGSLFVDGAPEEVARDPRVKAVYLGEEADA
jgi:ABC-type branched-subunit amino acid transport system ATPase component